MPDVLTPEQRRFCMSRNRGSDTGPELILRRQLFRRGLRYRLSSGLLGKPDLVFRRARVVVFVDGCFWHGCPEHATKPKTNAVFWESKITKTKTRDAQVEQTLRESGWLVIRLWEHEVREDVSRCADLIEDAVQAARQ